MTVIRRQLIIIGVTVIALLALHALLAWLLGERHVAATLLAAGSHSPLLPLLAALLFIVVRLVTVVLLPGWIGYRLVVILSSRVAVGRWRREPPRPPD